MKTPISPWTPVEASCKDNACTVKVWDRSYTVDSDLLFTSIVSRGNEILSAPMRLIGLENGEKIKNILLCRGNIAPTIPISIALFPIILVLQALMQKEICKL